MNIRRSLATAVLLATAAAPLATAAPAFAESTPAGLEKIDEAGAKVADEENIATIKALLVYPNDYLYTAPSQYLRDRVAGVLAGTPEDRARFLAQEVAGIRESDARVKLTQIMSVGGPAVRAAAGTAMSGTIEDVRRFLDSGQYTARTEDENRAKLQKLLDDPTTPDNVREAAGKALAGTAADVETFLTTDLARLLEGNDRLLLTQIMSQGGPAVKAAAGKAMLGSIEDVRQFLKVGQFVARAEDEGRAELKRLMEDPATGPGVRAGAAKALAGTAEEVANFLKTELPKLTATDNRVKVSRLIHGGGPEVQKAARIAFDGSNEDIAAFLKEGLYVARAKDEANAKAAAEKAAAEKAAAEKAAQGNDGGAGQTGSTVTPVTDTTAPPATGTGTGTGGTPAVTEDQPVGGGRLAYTGTDAPLGQLGALGGAAVALGAGALLATRRRTATQD
ncbi:ALF repeat-containing protein [Kitasatospora sp. NPDC096147]|uniref:ALF repeat-containing protein n=1 Tax=Kitasatospora sp. NPDC096147 TaxID=3364093 RepID=UPI003812603E